MIFFVEIFNGIFLIDCNIKTVFNHAFRFGLQIFNNGVNKYYCVQKNQIKKKKKKALSLIEYSYGNFEILRKTYLFYSLFMFIAYLRYGCNCNFASISKICNNFCNRF